MEEKWKEKDEVVSKYEHPSRPLTITHAKPPIVLASLYENKN